MPSAKKKVRSIFIVYWFLLLYVVAALIWWFVALNRMNDQMTSYKLQEIKLDRSDYELLHNKILAEKHIKTQQYAGEGLTFLVLILAGAVFVYRAIRRELKVSQQQQSFMMAVAHELKTPIAVTLLNLETLQKRKLPDDLQQKLLGASLQEVNRLNGLCSNLLLTGQFEAGRYVLAEEEVDLSTLVRESVHQFALRFPARVLQSGINDGLSLFGDRLLLQMAVNNLIDNAIKYAPKDLPITVTLHKSEKLITLDVVDQGKGISAEEKNHIFEKFYRAGNEHTREAKGTGLGLYLTRRIALQHKGDVAVLDNLPSGSIFRLTFKALA